MSPSATSTTRDKLLDAAEACMLAKGYVASSVDEICSAAGVTKGSFFHYFPSKEELGKVLLQRFALRQYQRFQAACLGVEDPLERIYRIIDCAIATSLDPNMRGCLVGTLAQEVSETHPQLRDACSGTFVAFAAELTRDLAAARELHPPTVPFEPDALGPYILALFQGSMLLAKANQDRRQMAANLEHLKLHLRLLFGR